jgi:pimeloyl-ACP methyl ester carboxylesterase
MITRRGLYITSIIAMILVAGWLGTGTCLAEGSAYALLDGHKVHYLDQGQGEAAMVFIPGWRCDHTVWRKQAEAFASSHRLILIDLPGHGKSDKPEVEYTHGLFIRAVEAVMKHAGVERAVIVGHSMGASVARQFALKYPDMVTGVVIVDGALFEMPKDPEEQAKWKEEFRGFTGQFKGPDGEANAEKFIRSMFVPSTAPEIMEEVVATMMATPPYVAQSAMDSFMDPTLWSEEPVKAPTLAVYVENSELTPAFRAYMDRIFPNLTFVTEKDVDHFYMLAKPEVLNRPLKDYLTKLGGK